MAYNSKFTGEEIDAILEKANNPDTTLTVNGALADSKAAGDKISALEKKMVNVDDTLTVSGDAADAAVTGEKIDTLDAALKALGLEVSDGKLCVVHEQEA